MGNIKDGHKYLWGSVVKIGEIDKNIFLLQNDQFFTQGVEIFRKHVF